MRRTRITIFFVMMLTVLGVGTACESSQSNTVAFGKSDLPGGGLRIPHNERLHLSTDKKWVEKEGHLSDLIRLQWTADRAKPAIVWVDERGQDKTAIVSHDKANDPKQHDHKHLSFETTMSPKGLDAGQLFTRLEIPYDTDISEIRTHSANFNVMNGVMRIAGEVGTNREMQLGVAGKDNLITPRWGIRADGSPESKNNQGTDLQLVRYDDDGQALDSAVSIQRQTGNVGIGTTEPENKLDVNDDRIRIRNKFTPTSSNDPCSEGQMAWDEQYTYVCVSPNEWKRSELSTW
jgi:hypothetical protein